MEWKFSNAAAGSRSSGKSLVVSHMIDQSDQRPKATVGRHVLTGNAGAAGGLPPPLSPLPLQGEESSPRPDDFFQQDSSSTPRLYSPLFSTSPLLDHPVRLSDNDCDLDFVHEGEDATRPVPMVISRTCGRGLVRRLGCVDRLGESLATANSCLRCEYSTNSKSLLPRGHLPKGQVCVVLVGAAVTRRRTHLD